jgi:hypothetical protein
LAPLQKCEIYLQLVRGEVTMAEVAAAASLIRVPQVAPAVNVDARCW